jgi:hypothetical protein
VDMIHVAQDTEQWWALVNTVMYLQVEVLNWLSHYYLVMKGSDPCS